MRFILALVLFVRVIAGSSQSYDLSTRKPGELKTDETVRVGEIVLSADWQSIYFIQIRTMTQISSEEINAFNLLEADGTKTAFKSMTLSSRGNPCIFKQLTSGDFPLLNYDGAD